MGIKKRGRPSQGEPRIHLLKKLKPGDNRSPKSLLEIFLTKKQNQQLGRQHPQEHGQRIHRGVTYRRGIVSGRRI